MNNKTKVYRMHLNPDFNCNLGQDDVIKFCKEKGIIGVGWEDIKVHKDYKNETILKEVCDNSKYTNKPFNSLKILSKINAGDMIWTKDKENNVYYLCIVTKTWFETNPDIYYEDMDIKNFVCCNWNKIDKRNIPENILRSFKAQQTILQV